MVNILSKDAQNKLRTLYYVRLFSMLAFLVAFMFLLGAGLLSPSYLLAREEANVAKEYSTALQQTLALKESAGAGAALTSLAEEIALMKQYQSQPAVADALSAVISKLPKGVSISKILIAPPIIADGKIGIVGNAKTRAELLAFVSALQENPLFNKVVVPVSDLAGDTNLPFSLTFFITAKPK